MILFYFIIRFLPSVLPFDPQKYSSLNPKNNFNFYTSLSATSNCKAEGYFPNPSDCRKFYRCVSRGSTFQKYEFDCPDGTTFDPELQNCNFPKGGQNCQGGSVDSVEGDSQVPGGGGGGSGGSGIGGGGGGGVGGGGASIVGVGPPNNEEPCVRKPMGNYTQCSCQVNIFTITGAPDGVKKQIISFNGIFPGPVLRCTLGDVMVISVTNSLTNLKEPTTIHWHGIEQFMTPYFDGPEGVTQCPIIPGTSMIYKFQLLQSGTYWFHSHHSYQYTDGAWGRLLIDNPREVWGSLYDKENEITITLNDWRHRSGKILSKEFKEDPRKFPFPDSILINGHGVTDCQVARMKGFECNPEDQGPAIISVKAGKVYRIRVINTSASQMINFEIDGHRLNTIEVDGVDTVQVPPVDKATVWVAQRYSFLVNMNGTLNDYWIRATPPNANSQLNALAILRYERPSVPTPTSRPGSRPGRPPAPPEQGRPPYPDFDWNSTIHNPRIAKHLINLRNAEIPILPKLKQVNLQVERNRIHRERLANVTLPTTRPNPNPVFLNPNLARPFHSRGEPQAPDYFDQEIILMAAPCNTGTPGTHFCFNGSVFEPGPTNSLPILFQAIKGQPITSNAHPLHTPLPMQVIQLVINNQMGTAHPWHIHGHTFWVLGSGPGIYNAATDASKLNTTGVRRDTTGGDPNGWVVVRYIANNPGTWLFHCHINWHLEVGLGATLIEGNHFLENVLNKVPDEARAACLAAGVQVY